MLSLAVTLVLGIEPASAEKNVLVIHSYHANLSWTADLKRGIEQEFDQSEEDVHLFHEFLDAKRFPNLEHQKQFLDTIQTKYQTTSLDVVMVSDDPGLGVILKHRDTHFPEHPIVFFGINKVQPELLIQPNMTGVFETHDRLATAAEAIRQNGSEGIIILADSSETGQAESSKAAKILEIPNAPTEVVVLEDLTPTTLKHRLQDYPAHWPILLWGQLREDTPQASLIDFHEVPRIIQAAVPNPLYSSSSTHIGHGVVGGKVLDGEQHAREAVELANHILDGQSPDSLPPITRSKNTWFFDAQELKRFSIVNSQLPVGSKLINLQTSFYEEYRHWVWLTVGAFTATLLIIGLLIEVIRRRAIAARILQENQIRYKDLAEAGANVFWELDAQMRFTYISGDRNSLHGIKPEHFLGRSPQELLAYRRNVEFDWCSFSDQFQARTRIDHFRFRLKDEDKSLRIFELNGKPILKEGEFLGYRGIKREITQEYQLAEDLAYQATYDDLTGLLNRQMFDQTLQQTVNHVQHSGRQAVLCYLDLDQFKIVNDTAGHLVGDRLLSEIAHVIQQSVRPNDTLGRLGGDEFGLILESCGLSQAEAICKDIIEKVQGYRFHWAERQFGVGVSIGLVPISAEGGDAVELLSRADLACYRAKDLGRRQAYVAESGDSTLATQKAQMSRLATLSQAFEENRFYLMQQPIVALEQSSLSPAGGCRLGQEPLFQAPHFEVLLRLRDEQGKTISPGLFIPEAERYGLITQIDRWVLQTVLKALPRLNLPSDGLVSINLSGASLSNEPFLADTLALLREMIGDDASSPSICPQWICFEITETAAIAHLETVKGFIHDLKALGIRFALDDFGSGVSSFGYLRELPVDFLKIDGSLVKNIHRNATDRAIVALINDLAHMMSIQTIAEFVENDSIRQCLCDIGVDYAQGYGIGRPMPLEIAIANQPREPLTPRPLAMRPHAEDEVDAGPVELLTSDSGP